MKKMVVNVLSMMAFVCLLTVAGYSQQTVLTADVPFDFTVGKKTFPAGEYRVVRIAPHTLSLRDSNDGFLMAVVTDPVMSFNSRVNPKLKFESIDGRYILREVWPGGATTGYELLAPKRLNRYAQKQPATTVGEVFIPVASEK